MVIDGASGVGGMQVSQMELFKESTKHGLEVELINNGSDVTRLNEGCGAEAV